MPQFRTMISVKSSESRLKRENFQSISFKWSVSGQKYLTPFLLGLGKVPLTKQRFSKINGRVR